MKIFLFYLFLLVITDPYRGINYNQVNTYQVNYCSHYCYDQNYKENDHFNRYDEDEDWEDEINEEFRNEEKPLIFDLDSWFNKK